MKDSPKRMDELLHLIEQFQDAVQIIPEEVVTVLQEGEVFAKELQEDDQPKEGKAKEQEIVDAQDDLNQPPQQLINLNEHAPSHWATSCYTN